MSRTQPINTAAAVLWASAFVIFALIIVQAGRLPAPAARAETVAARDDYTLLTARSGRGPEAEPDETLFVIDNREGLLLVYEVADAQRGQVLLRDGGPLPNLFRSARR